MRRGTHLEVLLAREAELVRELARAVGLDVGEHPAGVQHRGATLLHDLRELRPRGRRLDQHQQVVEHHGWGREETRKSEKEVVWWVAARSMAAARAPSRARRLGKMEERRAGNALELYIFNNDFLERMSGRALTPDAALRAVRHPRAWVK